MPSKVVAKIWWEAPHEGLLERFMVAEDVVRFGRSSECDIRVGYAPVYEPQVPRLWGELSWHRGSVFVQNLSNRWGLVLVPASDTSSAVRVPVLPGAAASPPVSRFSVLAQAPGVEVVLEVMSARQHTLSGAASEDPPSFVPFVLTPTQQLVGRAVIAPFLAGGSRRASYAEIARTTHYAERTVREAVAAMDGLFVLHRLVDQGAGGDSLDRVAHTLRLHTSLLNATR